MRYWKKLIDIVLIFVLFVLIYYCSAWYYEFIHQFPPKYHFHPLFLESIQSSAISLVYFLLSMLCFKNLVTIKINANIYIKIIITILLIAMTYSINLYWVIHLNALLMNTLMTCQRYGPMLLGAWLALLCGDRLSKNKETDVKNS